MDARETREHAALRAEVRDFLAIEGRDGNSDSWVRSWDAFDPDFSRRLGQRGWVGMTLPAAWGGGGRSVLERHVVIEELLAAGAPVGAHWIADRQFGPMVARLGTYAQKQQYLTALARGELFVGIGLSEPEAGSDLSALRTSATRTPSGWRLDGRKVWSSFADRAHVMLVLARSDPGSSRRAGLSQFIVPMDVRGVRATPIAMLDGEGQFCEVTFDDVELGDEALLGVEGEGWAQVTQELAWERSGPERFMSDIRLLWELLRSIRQTAGASRSVRMMIGRATAELIALRRMSWKIAVRLDLGEDTGVAAAMVKDLGADFEQRLVDLVRDCLAVEGVAASTVMRGLVDYAVLHAPVFSIRGGTREILRGVVAKGLGVR